ncbi:alanine--tRNA ligase [Piscinibacterium candidicorallinum]|uniref:Alanine--tRNA ligase n=1 Tax=Piscinibacterium candidicorallinum TaxID=1793872 RepID=A0ABV7H1U5_9BURK
MKAAEIREKFLSFFESKGHTRVRASSLVPGNDPTLLFVNSGMVQFKDVFLGTDKRAYTRATTAQKSLRAGGKHNDLENVGYTARHHTFFEMLGNFSFGDYFKRDALKFAWELLTEVYKLPKDKLWATVYAEDDEAYDIWHKEIGLPADRIVRIGDNKGKRYASDNFWQMADTGPCGPCSEIFYDHGPEVAGGPPGSPEADGDRYIEIWNNVFMQFDMQPDGSLIPLPKPCVDTGMGLERLAAVLQHVHSNYEIDLFQALIKAAARETGCADLENNSLKVIADHIRATAFLVADGVIPSNEGRGYVQRRIVRRAIRHGYKLGCRKPFFHKLVPDLVAQMGEAYPEIAEQQQRIMDTLAAEEARFFETLEHGMSILDGALAGGVKTLDGEVAFKLHDTYGFPLDLTADVGRERGFTVDEAGFNAAMARQQEASRAAGKFKMDRALDYSGAATTFHGYDKLVIEGAKITALYVGGTEVAEMKAGDSGVVVLDNTPFYAESGGQVGDVGVLTNAGAEFAVQDTQKIQSTVFGHHGTLTKGALRKGDALTATVNGAVRAATMRNHSVTHIMHKALREVLGSHVQQKGSLVDADKTRFDFAHNAPMTDAQMREVEAKVNAEIIANSSTLARVVPMEDAQKLGAMMLFGEKYGDEVRVLDIGTSRELCGGTHVERTGDIGFFKIVSEGGVAAGVRRVEAITGMNAVNWVQRMDAAVGEVAAALKAQPTELVARVAQVQDQIRLLEKELAAAKSKLAAAQGSDLAGSAVDIKGIKVLAARLEGADAKTLRETMDQLKAKLKTAAIVLAAVEGGKVQLAAGATADVMGRIKAGDLVNFVAQQVGGKGGGKPDMAMAGGTDAAALPKALESVRSFVEERA